MIFILVLLYFMQLFYLYDLVDNKILTNKSEVLMWLFPYYMPILYILDKFNDLD